MSIANYNHEAIKTRVTPRRKEKLPKAPIGMSPRHQAKNRNTTAQEPPPWGFRSIYWPLRRAAACLLQLLLHETSLRPEARTKFPTKKDARGVYRDFSAAKWCWHMRFMCDMAQGCRVRDPHSPWSWVCTWAWEWAWACGHGRVGAGAE